MEHYIAHEIDELGFSYWKLETPSGLWHFDDFEDLMNKVKFDKQNVLCYTIEAFYKNLESEEII